MTTRAEAGLPDIRMDRGQLEQIVMNQGPNPSMAFIQKPFSPSRLLAKVREILDAKAPSHGA